MLKKEIIKRLIKYFNNYPYQNYIKDSIIAVKRNDYKRMKNNLLTNFEDKTMPLVFYDFFDKEEWKREGEERYFPIK